MYFLVTSLYPLPSLYPLVITCEVRLLAVNSCIFFVVFSDSRGGFLYVNGSSSGLRYSLNL